MKKIIYSVGITLIVLGGVYYYITRPVSAPSTLPLKEVPEIITEETDESDPTYNIGVGSQAEFHIGEILRGKPFMVVGIADTLSGTMMVSENIALEHLLSIGEIKINARTFKTDSPQRDGAIGRVILKSENPEYEFITFVPKPGSEIAVAPNGSFSDSIPGTLTIAGISKPATIAVSGTVTEGGISGIAETTVARADFNLTIPNLSFLANVDEMVVVKATIVAPIEK